jgi:hypothetical protein
MLTPTLVFIGCALVVRMVVIRRIREYREERETISEQARYYDSRMYLHAGF